MTYPSEPANHNAPRKWGHLYEAQAPFPKLLNALSSCRALFPPSSVRKHTNGPVTNRGLGLSKLSQTKTNSRVLTGWVRQCWWRRFPAALRTGLCMKPGATSGHVIGSRPQTARCISGKPLRKSHPALSACPLLVPGRTAVRRDVNTLVSEEGKDKEVNTMIYYTAPFLIFFLCMKTAQLIIVPGKWFV